MEIGYVCVTNRLGDAGKKKRKRDNGLARVKK